ncbi:ABC transporter substrate-binding protein [Frankia sp. Mgl5]|uniref:ABC transporter substrate-binding protein n=1 Tax=Frankia sp. Mgl5 TaxID=2933793 RepID=UPI00200FADA1|nr:ABC transporter substrate-binding protein [Frankia sp. Mgl5]MCK9931272.1 ABC transporter substrate-binding protein [Frankia sp. Mgl5]
MRKSRLLGAAVACCAALVLGACGSGDSSPSAGTAGPSGEPVAGGTARILILSDPRSLDPASLGNQAAITAVLGNALYGTLMTTDETGKVAYSMAESFATTDGGATFALKLRPDLVFSDGTPFDAAAVKFNWDRLKDPASASPSAAEAAMVASTEVVDDVTLKVTMTTPVTAYAQAIVGSAMNWIASPAALRKGQQTFDESPVGAGPFTLKSWTRQAEIRLVKNPRYWDAPKPYLDGITMRAVLDADQRYNTLISDGADVAVETNWINLAKAEKAGLPTELLPLSGGYFIALNTRREPFNDIRARQAVAAALDIDALNLAVYNGEGQVVDTLFTKNSPFYSDKPLTTVDRAKAQKLFDELAAEGKPVSFTFSTYPSSENRAIAENVQAQLGSFKNVKVEVATVDYSQVGAMRTTHDFDAIVSAAAFQDPEPRLLANFTGNSPANMPGLVDPELDKNLLAGRTGTSLEQRKAAYDAAQARLTEEMPAIFLTRSAPAVITGKNVGGIVQYGAGSLLPEDLWIAK